MIGLRRRFRRWAVRYALRNWSVHDPLTDPNWLRPLARGKINAGGDALADSAWVYRCIRILADNAAKVPLKLFNGEGEDAKPVESGPWFDLLRRPNPRDSGERLVWRTVALKELEGAAFWVLEGNGEALRPGEIPTEIWPMSACVFRPVDPTAPFLSGWWMQTKGGQEIHLAPHQVMVHMHPDPRSAWGWIAPLRAAAENVQTEVLARRRNRNLLANNAEPAGSIEVDEDTFEDDVAIRRLRELHEDMHGGPDNAGRVGIFPPGTKWHPSGLSPKDLDWLGGLTWDRQTVASVFGVPLFMLGIVKDMNRETSRTSRRTFWQETEEPLLVTYAHDVNHGLIEPRGGGATMAAIGAPSRRETAVVAAFDFSAIPELQTEILERLDAAAKGRTLGIALNELIVAHSLPYESDQ